MKAHARKAESAPGKRPMSEGDLFGAGEARARKAAAPPAAPKRAARAAQPLLGTLAETGYDASSIEVLEGLEPVRRRPGMYIGGTDEKALHHLFAEVIDNAMDEAVAGHATFIEVEFEENGYLTVTDNGRGIPVDPHPKFPNKSALEVIMTTLHSGGKFDSQGLRDLGRPARRRRLGRQRALRAARGRGRARPDSSTGRSFARGLPQGKLETLGRVHNRRGTKVRFHPDPQIFGKEARFQPRRLFKMARSKAYLFGGVEIRWNCAPALVAGLDERPGRGELPLPGRPQGLSGEARSTARSSSPTRSSPARSRSPAATARSNGRSPGWRPRTASPRPTATPSRRRTAARTRAACASRSCAACASMPSGSARRSA